MNQIRMTASVFLAILLFIGCGTATPSSSAGATSAATASVQAETTPDGSEQGYMVNRRLEAIKLPEDAQDALDKALEPVAEAAYDPIALLAKQIVNGTNYSILCKITPSAPASASHLDVVTVSQDPDGNIEDMTIVPFDLAEVTDTDHIYSADPDTDGGFVINTEYYQDIDESAAAVFERAIQTLENNTGDTYSYIAELGSDSRTSKHAFLALKNPEDPDTARWAVMTIYEPGSDVSLSSVYELDPAVYSGNNAGN